jgi:anaerobic selenocysteine-containing dehydrogenase
VRGLPEVGGNLPAAVMAEEMETPGPGQIRGFVSVLGNPVASVPNSARLDRALAGLEFMVSLDFYINETSRHAHIILPGSHALERSQYDVVFHALQVRNTAKYSLPVLPPAPDSRTDWDILYDLSMRLGGRAGWAATPRQSAAAGPSRRTASNPRAHRRSGGSHRQVRRQVPARS